MAASTEQNLRLFRELISCMRELYFWTYDPEMKPTYTNCPEPETAGLLFEKALYDKEILSASEEKDFVAAVKTVIAGNPENQE